MVGRSRQKRLDAGRIFGCRGYRASRRSGNSKRVERRFVRSIERRGIPGKRRFNGDDFDKVGIQIGFEFDWDAGFHGGVLLCAGVIDVLQEKIRFPKKESGFGGEKGIRTLDTFIGYTRFPIVRLRPTQLRARNSTIYFTRFFWFVKGLFQRKFRKMQFRRK